MSESDFNDWIKENNILYDGKIWGRENALSLEVDYSYAIEILNYKA